MNVTGNAIYAGAKHGMKNDKAWMNLFLDDEDDILQRMQIFVPSELHNTVANLQPGCRVSCSLRLYMRQTSKYPEPACSLVSIQAVKS